MGIDGVYVHSAMLKQMGHEGAAGWIRGAPSSLMVASWDKAVPTQSLEPSHAALVSSLRRKESF